MIHFYHKEKDAIVCDLCFRHCRIEENGVGFCGIQVRLDDSLHTSVTNHPAAMNIDPIEKKPLFHFLPGTSVFSIGTVGCNLRCPFCQNSSLSFERESPIQRYSSKDIIGIAVSQKVQSIAFTYNEPTIFWPWARDIAFEAKEHGIKTVMVTNGAMSDKVALDMIGLIDAVNIDLKCGSEKTYSETLKGNLPQVLHNIEYFVKKGIWVELTTLIVPGLSDSLDELSSLADSVLERCNSSIPWHISAFHPVQNYDSVPATYEDSIVQAVDLIRNKGFKYVYSGNIGRENQTLCPSCNAILIKRKQYSTTIVNSNISKCDSCGTPLEGVYK